MRIKAEFGPDRNGNPVWYHRVGLSVIIGVVIGAILGAMILVAEL